MIFLLIQRNWNKKIAITIKIMAILSIQALVTGLSILNILQRGAVIRSVIHFVLMMSCNIVSVSAITHCRFK